MNRKTLFLALVLLLALAIAVPVSADPGKPDFGPHVYADGVAWGTKVTTVLPASNGNNGASFDKFFVVTNNPQLPVGEAAPRNPAYNGGRWVTYTATWLPAAFEEFETLPVLKSYADIMHYYEAGFLDVAKGSPEGGPPPYFQCPLLPVK